MFTIKKYIYSYSEYKKDFTHKLIRFRYEQLKRGSSGSNNYEELFENY